MDKNIFECNYELSLWGYYRYIFHNNDTLGFIYIGWGPYLHIESKFADDGSERPSEGEKPKELEVDYDLKKTIKIMQFKSQRVLLSI